MDIGKVIKILRKKQNINQKELAAQCEISQAYLSQIEGNQKEPHLSTLKIIAEKLNIPLPILFFMSLEERDISEKKREAFTMINPAIKSMLNEFFSTAQS